MDFSFSEEQQAIRALARELLAAEATTARVAAAERTPLWRDDELWKRAAEANLLGIAVPEAQGGMGMGFAELCVLFEEVGRACAPGPWRQTLAGGALALAEFGSAAQQAAWLPKLAAGEALASVALREADAAVGDAGAGADAGAGNNFVARAVPCANSADAFVLPSEAGVYLLPAARAQLQNARTLSTGEPVFDLHFESEQPATAGADDETRLPCTRENFLAWLRPRALTALAAMQLGVVDRAIEITAGYAREREQFGAPIGSFQAVQHQLADAFIARDVLRWTTWNAVFRLTSDEASRAAQVAGYWAAEAGARVTAACVHLHGGTGADVSYPIHRYFLWAKSLELQAGGASSLLAALGDDLHQHGLAADAAEAAPARDAT